MEICHYKYFGCAERSDFQKDFIDRSTSLKGKFDMALLHHNVAIQVSTLVSALDITFATADFVVVACMYV